MSSDMEEFDDAFIHLFLDKMKIYFKIFGPLMVSRIGSNTDSGFVVTIYYRKGCKNVKVNEQISKPGDFSSHRCKGSILSFCRRFVIIGCFLDFQETREFPKKM